MFYPGRTPRQLVERVAAATPACRTLGEHCAELCRTRKAGNVDWNRDSTIADWVVMVPAGTNYASFDGLIKDDVRDTRWSLNEVTPCLAAPVTGYRSKNHWCAVVQ